MMGKKRSHLNEIKFRAEMTLDPSCPVTWWITENLAQPGAFLHDTQRKERRPIIYVEDNRSDANLFSQALLQVLLGRRAASFHDGESAQVLTSTMCQIYRPDLILMDMNLPREPGNPLIRWIRQRSGFEHLPIIPVPAAHVSRKVQQTKEAGAHLLVVKPPDYDGCIDLVYRAEGFSGLSLNARETQTRSAGRGLPLVLTAP